MEIDEIESRTGARLSAQRAMLGNIGPHLYAACIRAENDLVTVIWFVAPDLTDEEREDLGSAGAEIIADYPAPWTIDERFVEVVDPAEPLAGTGVWVLLQRGFQVRSGSAT